MPPPLDAKKANDTFNVGAGEFKTVREDMKAMCDYAGNGARPWGTPAGPVKLCLGCLRSHWNFRRSTSGSTAPPIKTASSPSKRRRSVLGWEPQYSNAQALIRSYQWYLDHKHEIAQGTGITHRIAWNQGILKFFKKFM